jgi:hypothetical protein
MGKRKLLTPEQQKKKEIEVGGSFEELRLEGIRKFNALKKIDNNMMRKCKALISLHLLWVRIMKSRVILQRWDSHGLTDGARKTQNSVLSVKGQKHNHYSKL